MNELPQASVRSSVHAFFARWLYLICIVVICVQERLMIADMAVASCEFMFEETRNYVLQRKAFGKTIAHLQVCTATFCNSVRLCCLKRLRLTSRTDRAAQTGGAKDRNLRGPRLP